MLEREYSLLTAVVLNVCAVFCLLSQCELLGQPPPAIRLIVMVKQRVEESLPCSCQDCNPGPALVSVYTLYSKTMFVEYIQLL